MKSKLAVIYVALLFVLVPLCAFAKLTVMSPVDFSITEKSTLTIIGAMDGGNKDEITITVQGSRHEAPAQFKEFAEVYDGVFNLDVELYEGENIVTVDTLKIKVFYKTGKHEPPNNKYQKIIFHKAVLKGCDDCHDTKESGLPLVDTVISDICKSCHPRDSKKIIVEEMDKSGKIVKKENILVLKNMHQPVLEGKCMLCHAPHSSPNEHLIKSASVSDLCKKCHEKVFKAIENATKKHPPQADGKCVECHSPHASNDKYLFKDSLDNVCFHCHKSFLKNEKNENKQFIHAPVSNGKCYECHDLHFSQKSGFFRTDTIRETCIKCHDDKKFGRHTESKESCLMCHDKHASDNKKLMINGKIDTCRKCHADIFAGEYAHSAINGEKGCQECHDLHSPEDLHDLKGKCLTCHSDAAKLASKHGGFNIPVERCVSCHSIHYSTGKFLLAKNQHPPFQDGDCKSCHKDVGEKVTLVEKGKELCYQCHDSKEVAKDKTPLKSVHTAVAEGECADCHSPHSSDFNKFIIASKGTLCFNCHDGLVYKQKGQKFNTVHPPTEEGACTECHNPHGSMIKSNLNEKVETLCFNCHDDLTKDLKEGAIVHPPYEEKDCTACHNTHGTDAPFLIKNGQIKACAQCHDDKTKDKAGVAFATVHKPVAEGRCSDCHDPHVAKFNKQLKIEGNALCQSCHKTSLSHHQLKAVSNSPNTVIGAEFKKDGDDLACIGCHDPHATNNPRMFRGSKPAFCDKCHNKN